MNPQPILPPGWVLGDPLEGSQSPIVSVASGDGVNATVPKIILAREVPPGARVYLERMSLRVVDQAAYDQLYFALRRNGAKISPWDKISGEQVVEDHFVAIEQTFESGLLEIVGINISGTGAETGAAADAVAVRVIARLFGYLLRYVGDR